MKAFVFFFVLWGVGAGAVIERPPLYSVWDYEIYEAYGVAGQKFRIATIATREDVFPIGATLVFGKETLSFRESGNLGLDGLGYFDKLGLKPGPAKVIVDSGQLKLQSIFQVEPFELRPVEGQKQIRFSRRLVKICNVEIKSGLEKYWAKKSYGIAELPTRKEKVFTRISIPPCYEASDRVFEQGTLAKTPEIENQARLSKEEDKKEDVELRRREFILNYEREIKKQIEITKVPYEVSKEKEAAYLQSRICPQLLPYMKVLGVRSISLSKKTTPLESKDGYSHSRTELKGLLSYEDGKSEDVSIRFYDQSLMRIESAFLGGSKCLVIKLADNRDNFELEKDLYRSFENTLNKIVDMRAYLKAQVEVR